MPITMSNFSELLKGYMVANGMSEERLSQEVGMAKETLHRWKTDRKPGKQSFRHIKKMVEIFQLEGDERDNFFTSAGFPRNLISELKNEPPPRTEKSPISCFAYDNYWVGREKLVADLSAKMQENCRVLVLVGITGIGKTALGEKLAVDLQENWAHFDRVNFDDEAKLTDFTSVATDLLTGWGEPVTPDNRKNTKQLLSRLVKRLRENQHLLLIDSLENILKGNEQKGWSEFKDEWWPKFFQSLLAGEDCQSTVILTSQDLPAQITQAASRYQNFFYSQILRGLEGAKQLALFEKMGLDVDIDSEGRAYLKRIAEAYEGHPLALRTIAGEIGGEPFCGNILAYWNQYAKEQIEKVEKAIKEAKAGIMDGADDQFKLHRHTQALRIQLRSLLEKTFERLKLEFRNAYLLLCLASFFRCAVQKNFWLSQLEAEGCDKKQQKLALEALRNRYLVAWGSFIF